MKAFEVKIDLEELRKFKIQNAKERIEFIDFLAEYIRTHEDKEWSEQQKRLVNAQIKGKVEE